MQRLSEMAMLESSSMNPFVEAQVRSIIEDLRFLEISLSMDLRQMAEIRLLRQTVPLLEAAELSQEENQRLLSTYGDLSEAPLTLAIETARHLGTSLSVLEASKSDAWPFTSGWTESARQVNSRVLKSLGESLRLKIAKRIKGLYVIMDPVATNGRPVLDVAKLVLEGGASVIQFRDKFRKTSGVLATVRDLKVMCDGNDVLFIVNDDPLAALASQAHGLHVGQNDISVVEARRLLGPGQIIGRSNNSLDEVTDSQGLGTDYLAVGAVYSTKSVGKAERPVVGVEMISRVKEIADQPVVAIGGINIGNIGSVIRAGADCICVVSAVTIAPDPKAATSVLVEAIINAKR